MAGFSFKIKAPKSLNLREWMWVIILGVILTIISLISQGGLALPARASGCQVTVVVDTLNERAAANLTSAVTGTLTRGQVVSATKTLDAGFRLLSDGKWVSNQAVTPTAGSVCS